MRCNQSIKHLVFSCSLPLLPNEPSRRVLELEKRCRYGVGRQQLEMGWWGRKGGSASRLVSKMHESAAQAGGLI